MEDNTQPSAPAPTGLTPPVSGPWPPLVNLDGTPVDQGNPASWPVPGAATTN